MLTLEFRDQLTQNRFAGGNNFSYLLPTPTGIICTDKESEWPYILRATDKHPGEEIHYSNSIQFSSRQISIAKVKEILDSAKMPLVITSTNNVRYLVGKGFLAHLEESEIKLLFVAVCNRKATITSMNQIKFVISRSVFEEPHKRVSGVVKDMMTIHRGDTLITSQIEAYIGHRLTLPVFKTLRDRSDYLDKLRSFCLEKYREKLLTESVISR